MEIFGANGTIKAEVSPTDNSTRQYALMGDNVLNLSFTLPELVNLEVNDYIDFQGERFTLLSACKPLMVSTLEYRYTPKFYGIQSECKKALMLKTADGEMLSSFSLDDSPLEHVRLAVENINRLKGTGVWTVGTVLDGPRRTVEYNNVSCFDALTLIAETFETEWFIEGATVNLIRCEHGSPVSLGYMNGLRNLSREENDNAKFFTRLYPVGSKRNIVKDDYGYTRLQLPEIGGVRPKYIEKGTEEFGVFEQVEESEFADIYPKRVGTVSFVDSREQTGENGEKFTVYYFKDAGLDFDPNDYEMAGLVKNVSFQSGDLNGREFEVNFDSATKEFEIITQFPYDEGQLPGGRLIPEPGDTYILYNIGMPSEYYGLAENEFSRAVDTYMERYSVDASTYKADTDFIDLDEQNIRLTLGRRVTLKSDAYFKGSRESRVVGFTQKINNPSDMNVSFSNAVGKGRLETIETEIEKLQSAVEQSTNFTILKSWDSTDPSEYNVLSSVRALKTLANEIKKLIAESDKKYLRKDIEDAAAELIRFLKGIEVTGETSTERLLVKENAFFRDTLSSEKFVSGFPGGTGWALLWKEFLNAAGVTEKKAALELDEITVRGPMRIYEMIISQLSGENGTRLTTDMMRIVRIDAADKKIYLDTESGVLYNPFRKGDILMALQFGGPDESGGYSVNKQYELSVSGVGIGEAGEEREDWITYDAFVGDTNDVAARDVLTRVDSLTNLDRKGIIKHTSVEPGSPYIDILYGMKTDPENAVRMRAGRLDGIITYLWGQLRGYGLYCDNAYLTGDFRLKNGDDVRTRFEVLEGKFTGAMQSITNTLTDEDNFLSNAVFKDDLACWEYESGITMYEVNGVPLDIVSGFYSQKDTVADIATFDGRLMLRIKNSSLRQLNTYIKKPDAGSELFLTLKYYCIRSGTLTAGFAGSAPYINKTIQAENEFQTLETSGFWDSEGNFILAFTGDIYIERLTLTNHPLADYQKKVSTLFEQTDTYIKATATRVDRAEGDINGIRSTISSAGWITTADGNRFWAKVETVDALGNRVTANESALNVTALQISAVVTRTDKTERDISGIQSTINSAGWITTADGNTLWAKHETVGALGNRVTSAESELEVTAQKISGVVVRTDKAESAIGEIQKTIASAGWITTADGNTLWAKHETVSALGNRVSVCESNLSVTAGQISGVVIRTDKTENAIGEIQKTIASAGWITTADGNTLWAKKSLENGSEIISYINQDASSVAIKASKIKLEGHVTANGNVQFTTEGKIIAVSGSFTNVNVQGAFKSPFRDGYYEIGTIGGGGTVTTDGIHNNNNVIICGGDSWGTGRAFQVPFTSDFNGFRVTLLNEDYGSKTSVQKIAATAPSGKYFYENGYYSSTLTVYAHQGIEMIGVGEGSYFRGWLILNRFPTMNYNPAGGVPTKVIYAGATQASGVMRKYYSYSNDKVTCTRVSEGKYRVTFGIPLDNTDYVVFATAESSVGGRFASVTNRAAGYFEVYTGDDSTPNDSAFNFAVINTGNWKY